MNNEREYIGRCKLFIEEKFGFKSSDGKLRQRDLEYLAECIEEKSGIRLSLSTLKRLWQEDYGQTPHPSTLSALVSLLGFKDWQEFRLSEAKNSPPVTPSMITEKSRPFKKWIALPLLAAIFVLFWLIAFNTNVKTGPFIKGPVTFRGSKTVSQGVPNTIIFNYDVSNIKADSFFFQQAWNDQEKVKIDPNGHHYSNIYYYPGYHKAKLIADDSIVSRFPVHITTDGWLPLIRYSYMDNVPVYVKKDNLEVNGALHVTYADLISSHVKTDIEYMLSYFNVREFENTLSDNFALDTRIMCDNNVTVPCPGFELVIFCEVHIFFVRLTGKGCERNLAIKMGEVIQDGINNDLSAFGTDLHEWQHLRVNIVDKQATIYLNGNPVHSIPFKNDFGRVVGLSYNFLGTGAIDYARLTNGENKIVLDDDFGR